MHQDFEKQMKLKKAENEKSMNGEEKKKLSGLGWRAYLPKTGIWKPINLGMGIGVFCN